MRDCGLQSSPCQHLTQLSDRLADGDNVFIMGSSDSLQHCMDARTGIWQRIRIIGINGIPQISCNDTSDSYMAIFSFIGDANSDPNPYILLQDITFVTGRITGVHAPLYILNCSFVEATVMLGALHEFYGTDYSLFHIENRTLWERLFMVNTTWHHAQVGTDMKIPDVLAVPSNIWLITRNGSAYIENSYLANRRFYIESLGSLAASFVRCTFEGNPSGETKIGGIYIQYSYQDSNIIISDCTFRDLCPSNVLLALLHERDLGMWLTRPVVLISKIKDPPIYSDNETSTTISIQKCVFTGNNGGIFFMGTADNLRIEGCVFLNNHVLFGNGGAAIFLREGTDARTRTAILSSTFIGNTAGDVRPYKIHVHPQNISFRRHGSNTISIASFSERGFSVTEPESVFGQEFPIFSDGGAVHIKYIPTNMVNCTFSNNTANRYGGAVKIAKVAQSTLKNVLFEGSILEHEYESGDLLYVRTVPIELINCTFISGYSLDRSLFQFYGSAKLRSITVKCKKNHVLHLNTAGAAAFSHRLSYTCVSCKEGYSLVGGSLSILTKDALDNAPTSENTNIKCYECPYGGYCDKNIRAKKNFWGAAGGLRVYFYRCPPGYCCPDENCTTYDFCRSHRSGRLCGGCQHGFSEALFSTECVSNSECHDRWIFAVLLVVCITYAIFLLVQNDVKNAIESQCSILFRGIFETARKLFCSQKEPTSSDGFCGQGNGAFIILLFYYFQDASLIQIPPSVTISIPTVVSKFCSLFDGLFKFRLDIFSLIAKNVCVFSGLDPKSKVALKVCFIPLLLFILMIIYAILIWAGKHSVRKTKPLMRRTITAIILAIMFSYQKITVSCFCLLHCVPVLDQLVLFIDGNVSCYQSWQVVAIVFAAVNIIPFWGHLCISPSILDKGWISHREFFAACLCPLPFIISWIVRFVIRKPYPVNSEISEESRSIVDILQGPFRQFMPSKCLYFCWSGVLIGIRLLLVLCKTFIVEVLQREVLMLLITTLAFGLQLRIQPYKDGRSNWAGNLSCAALMAVCFVNLVRAGFTASESIPTGPHLQVVLRLEMTENLLLFWIPMFGVCFLALLLSSALALVIVDLAKGKMRKIRRNRVDIIG